jgi:hypothetical protein
MRDPTEDQERAERIKQLRAGEADTRQRRRRPEVPDEPPELASEVPEDTGVDHDEPGRPEDVDLPDDAPADLTAASMYLTEDLKGKTERIEEHLHLRYEVEFGTSVDGPRHLRPLALYLGLRQLEQLELSEVEGLFEQVDAVESPATDDDDADRSDLGSVL